MNIEEILNYQKKDFEIIKLERSLNESPNKKIINQIQNIVKDSQSTSAALETEAEEVLLQFNNLKKLYEDNINSFIILSKKESDTLNEAEAAEIIKLTNAMASNLNILEKKLLALAEKVNAILSGYDEAKKKYQKAKIHYKDVSENFNAEKNELSPRIAKLSEELKKMETKIESKLFTLYKEKRQDRIFPIFVEFTSNCCGGCMMELPSAQIEKLKRENMLECENCHRYIYLKQPEK
ncbi:MAG: hypothetical protein PHH71_02640 [Clostridia bacterium]|nr:hypothetical protein [Clostridia bacterium]MDD3862537.1 hypothetical protein [Clostridia bacterium]MDD4408344.1 hypothetical protein [Clostridia bacterium]